MLSFLIFLFLVNSLLFASGNAAVVGTKSGRVRGASSLSRGLREYYSWQGIPYAQPPVGELRYADPVPVKPWNHTLIATRFGPPCSQALPGSVPLGSEDCLTLNVFTPAEAFDSGRHLPTMVFIHGGGFAFLSSHSFPPDYFMDEDVILVTLNYRLSSYGFLNTGDGVVRGNMGLKDQALALRWVKDNIGAFGGDPEKITIVGESAGACAVHYHMISPMSRGLFSKAISQSGSAASAWSVTDDPGGQAKEFASELNCPTEPSTLMVDCLRGKTTLQIWAARRRRGAFVNAEITRKSDLFLPSVEVIDDGNAFMVRNPLELLKDGSFEPVPWMTGINSAEGILPAMDFITNETYRRALDERWSSLSVGSLFLSPEELPSRDAIREFYFKGMNLSSADAIPAMIQLSNDRFFYVPFYKSVNLHAKRAPAYTYYYSREGPSLFNIGLRLNARYPRLIGYTVAFLQNWLDVVVLNHRLDKPGAGHSDELVMLAPVLNFYYIGRHHPDYEFSKDIVKLWAAFATDHTTMKFRGAEFLAFQPNDDPEFFQIDEEPKLVHLEFTKRMGFWDAVEKSAESAKRGYNDENTL